MNIVIEIKAPELSAAINTLAQALSGKKQIIEHVQDAPTEQQIQHPASTQQPMQQQAPAPVPTAPPVQQQVPVQQAPQPVPTSAPTYDMNQLAVAATQLMDAGKQSELLQLLSAFGVQALMQLPQEQYGAFATKLRELGAKL